MVARHLNDEIPNNEMANASAARNVGEAVGSLVAAMQGEKSWDACDEIQLEKAIGTVAVVLREMRFTNFTKLATGE